MTGVGTPAIFRWTGIPSDACDAGKKDRHRRSHILIIVVVDFHPAHLEHFHPQTHQKGVCQWGALGVAYRLGY